MKISVITVVFNGAATIFDTLSSVIRQTYPNIEHLIIDGDSKDETLAIIRRIVSPQMQVVSEPDMGIYDAMNKGIAAATGEIIGFINSDDFYSTPDVLNRVAEIFQDESIEACYGDLCYVQYADTSKTVRYWKSKNFVSGLFAKGWCPPHPTFFARRTIYEKIGGFDLSYSIAADFELMMRFLEVHNIRAKYIPDVLVNMRVGGVSNRSIKNIIVQNLEILRALKSHGFHINLFQFFGRKLIFKGKQFFFRST